MGIQGLHHLYVETADFDASVDFWNGLGFEFVQRWGEEGHRAGMLRNGSAEVVLAEVGSDPVFNPFFAVDDLDALTVGPGVEIVTPKEDTHWGTRWMQVRDPDGRVFSIEQGSA